MIGDTLKKAHALLTGDRNDRRGDPRPVYQKAAEIYEAWTGKVMDDVGVIQMMIAVKMAREQIKHDPDNAIDVAAYWDIYEYLSNENYPAKR